MSTRAFFNDPAKTAVLAAVQKVERQTCAELVVTVRRQAGPSYRDADLGFGAVVAIVVLAVVLLAPKEFATVWIPVDVALSFVVAALFCRYNFFLRRLLTSSSRRRDEAYRAACTAFHEMGIGRTSGRHGILVLVALFERKVAIVPDVGVDPALLRGSIAALERAVDRVNPDFGSFVAALESLGPALAETMPCRHDDVNELPDHMGVH